VTASTRSPGPQYNAVLAVGGGILQVEVICSVIIVIFLYRYVAIEAIACIHSDDAI